MAAQVETFVLALSFEPRVTAAFEVYAAQRGAGRLVCLDYRSTSTPGLDAASRRSSAYAALSVSAKAAGWSIVRRNVDAYSSRGLRRILEEVASDSDRLVVDLTCMTRAHAVAAASALACISCEWTTVYSLPDSYGQLKANRGDWRDTLFVPLSEDSEFRNQGMSLGVLLLGHEAARVTIALEEIEPSAGIVLIAESAGRPDVHRLTERSNAETLAYLESLVSAGPRAGRLRGASGLSGWLRKHVDAADPAGSVSADIGRLVRDAKVATPSVPIVLFPFGPKNLVFSVSYLLARLYPHWSWCICPVSRTHPLDYSFGVAGILTIRRAEYESAVESALLAD